MNGPGRTFATILVGIAVLAGLASCQSYRSAEATEGLPPITAIALGERLDSDDGRSRPPQQGSTGPAGGSSLPIAGTRDVTAYRTQTPHPAAASVPRAIESRIGSSGLSSLPALVAHLTGDEDDPFVRLKAIHDWIALEISYDVQGFLRGSNMVADAGGALRTGRAVCQGYSELFARMAVIAGFECEVVSGFGRGVGFSLFAQENLTRSNHAWNAVRVADGWYLVDATWDAGHLDGSAFRRNYSTAYFLITPGHMLYSHLPENPDWQLVAPPITKTDFATLPPLRGRYFATGLEAPPGIDKITVCASETELLLPGGTEARLQIRVMDQRGRSHDNRAMAVRTEDGHRVLVAFPSRGLWTARIFAMNREGTGGEWIADLGFQAREGSQHRFPTLYTPYHQDSCELIEPVWGPLRVGSSVRIRIRLPAHTAAFVDGGSTRESLTARGNDVYETTVTVPTCTELRVFAKRSSGGTSYEGILALPVER